MFHEFSIKRHPSITRIRNKRRRTRAVKKLNRRGIYTILTSDIPTPTPHKKYTP